MRCRTMLVEVDDEIYRASVLMVRSWDAFGRPLECELIYADRKLAVEDGVEFLIVYVQSSELQKREPT